ncbi:cation:proton antiporter regulatory subunit [Neomicrococcus aestuarii]|uniref:Potassium transporter TrkA n=1 Tax=Neomicrococcus aestuarii TaxID=556325 RepID=A0A1L2ZQ93_9MICC|nr:TrkA C-terminal domain-containing protein [Neomicrococcus aestuarii]APF41337.1 potassium transporter TrkA [Neomicrococcus aestuarii]
MNVEETPLPGIGTRREITVANGRRVGVIQFRDGEMNLLVSQQEDPDCSLAEIPLTTEEAAALGSMLGAPQLVQHLSNQQGGLAGLSTEQIVLPRESPYASQDLGATRLRTRTGVSIVALVRGTTVIPSPGPETDLLAGDVVVVVGTPRGIKSAAQILHEG